MLAVLNRQRRVPFDVAAARPAFEAAMVAAGVARKEVSLVLVSDASIQRLNRQWRGIPRPTDCLSFPAREGEGGRYAGRLLGDIVISLETALRQARENHPGTPEDEALREEVLFLFVHSLLHLLGHDHDEPRAERRMMAKTRAVLRAVTGIPEPI